MKPLSEDANFDAVFYLPRAVFADSTENQGKLDDRSV